MTGRSHLLENSAWRRALTGLSLAITAALSACTSDCDTAQQKLDSCADEIRAELAKRGNAGSPIGFSDMCSEHDRCVAGCVNLADCSAIATVTANAEQPPDNGASKDTKELYSCLQSCVNGT